MEHPEKLSQEELEAQDGQPLPDREAMSTISLDPAGIDNFAMPINEATAINYESTGSVAYADANQTVILGQTDTDADSNPGSNHNG